MRFELTVFGICNPMHWATLPPLHLVPRWRIELPYPPCKDGVLTVKLPRQKLTKFLKNKLIIAGSCIVVKW